MLKIGIIVGSTRPGRKAAAVAKWVHDILKSRKDADFEIVDIEDYKLPLLDEPVPPRTPTTRRPSSRSQPRWPTAPQTPTLIGSTST
jgi:NAD(P)H-dependent FMN reductase